MERLTTGEALTLALQLGFKVTSNTARRLAREHGLTSRFGHKIFFDKLGWERLLREGLADRHRDVRPPQG
jgi:hypothetical protein